MMEIWVVNHHNKYKIDWEFVGCFSSKEKADEFIARQIGEEKYFSSEPHDLDSK